MDAHDLEAIMGEFNRLIELRMQTQDPDGLDPHCRLDS